MDGIVAVAAFIAEATNSSTPEGENEGYKGCACVVANNDDVLGMRTFGRTGVTIGNVGTGITVANCCVAGTARWTKQGLVIAGSLNSCCGSSMFELRASPLIIRRIFDGGVCTMPVEQPASASLVTFGVKSIGGGDDIWAAKHFTFIKD
jgi:hypothetical protein